MRQVANGQAAAADLVAPRPWEPDPIADLCDRLEGDYQVRVGTSLVLGGRVLRVSLHCL